MRRWICAILLSAFAITGSGSALTTETLSPTSETEDLIWSILREEFSETATAAIMGNLKYESGGYSYRYEGLTIEESAGLNEKWKHNESKFTNSKYGFGLAGWTGRYNLEKLWNWCEEHGYDVDSAEGQTRFLIDDYRASAPKSAKRMEYYGPEDIVTACEDFRQSYEKSISTEYGQYKRAKWAKEMLLRYADIDTANVPYNFEIYIKTLKLNERIANELLLSER